MDKTTTQLDSLEALQRRVSDLTGTIRAVESRLDRVQGSLLRSAMIVSGVLLLLGLILPLWELLDDGRITRTGRVITLPFQIMSDIDPHETSRGEAGGTLLAIGIGGLAVVALVLTVGMFAAWNGIGGRWRRIVSVAAVLTLIGTAVLWLICWYGAPRTRTDVFHFSTLAMLTIGGIVAMVVLKSEFSRSIGRFSPRA